MQGMPGMARAASDPADYRYVGTNYSALPAEKVRSAMKSENPDDAFYVVAKRMPIRLQLVVDQRRLYRLLTECDRVALLIDNRCGHPDRMMEVEAITATGRAVRVPPGDAFARWSGLLLAKHSHLQGFVTSPSVALFRIEIVRFFHVERFQEVREWRPGI
jgi:hypothetical protein